MYKGFREAIAKPDANLRNAYQKYVHENPQIGKKSTYMKNAADRLTGWYDKDSTVPVPKLRPKPEPTEGFIVPETDDRGMPVKRIQI